MSTQSSKQTIATCDILRAPCFLQINFKGLYNMIDKKILYSRAKTLRENMTDAERNLQGKGFRVIRFWNSDVLLYIEAVLEHILRMCVN